MDFYHFSDADFDSSTPSLSEDSSTPSLSEGLYGYPSLGQMLTVEETNDLVSENLTNCWDTTPQPGPMVDASTSLWEATDNELAAEVASLVSRFDDNQQSGITCLDPHLLMDDQQLQPVHTGLLNQGIYFPNKVAASGVYTTIQAPSSVPFDYWGHNQNEPSASTFDWGRTGAGQHSYYHVDAIPGQSEYDQYHPNSGPARRGQTPTQRFKPYGTSCARETKHRNAEAGPSTLVPLQITDVHLQPLQPTGGLSPETAADAVTDQTITEGHEAPATENASYPNRQRKVRKGRKLEQADALELRHLVKRWKEFVTLPSRNHAVTIAFLYIQTVRMVVYPSPLLEGGRVQPSTASSEKAGVERERRKDDRVIFEALSRYYPLEGNVTRWNRPLLLKEVLKDLKVRHPPPELYNA